MTTVLGLELALGLTLALALAHVVVEELLKHIGHLATWFALRLSLVEGKVVVGLVHGVVHALAIALTFV